MPRTLKYLAVKEAIVRKIAGGELSPGDRAGSESTLANEYGVSKFSVIKAFTELVSDGLLYRQQGKGTFVREGARESALRLSGQRTVRLLRPYRKVSLDFCRRGIDHFESRFRRVKVELTEDFDEAEVVLTALGFGPEGVAGLLPLDRFFAASGIAERYGDDILDLFRRDGKLYALPRDVSPVLLYYNAELLQKAGVSIPDDSWTWKELLAATAAITDRTRGVYGFGIGRGMIFLAHFLRQNGGAIVDDSAERCLLDIPEASEAIGLVRDLEKASPLTPDGIGYGRILDAFVEGRIGMMAWGGALGAMLSAGPGFEWGAVSLPKGRRKATVRFSAAAAVSKTARDPQLCWELVRDLAGPETQEYLASAGYLLPACSDVPAEGDLADLMRGEMASALAARPFHAGNEYYVGGQLLIDLWDEYDDPVELAKEAARRVNAYLELSRPARATRREAALL